MLVFGIIDVLLSNEGVDSCMDNLTTAAALSGAVIDFQHNFKIIPQFLPYFAPNFNQQHG